MRLNDLIAPNPPATSATSATQQALKGEMSQKSQVSQGVERGNGFFADPIPESLDTVLADTCEQHGMGPAAIKQELQAAGDWPDLTPAALRCYVRCVAQERRNLEALPLADKLRAYGKPWPLMVDGRTVAVLVADEAEKRAHTGPEPCYTASEVETLAGLPDDEAKALCGWKSRFGGTIREVTE